MNESTRDSVEALLKAITPYLSSQLDLPGPWGHKLDKEDMLQEIRIRVWRAFSSNGSNIRHPGAYIKKIIQSVLANEMKKQKKDWHVIQLAEAELTQHSKTDGEISPPLNLQSDIVMAALAMLKETPQQVIKCRIGGLSFHEIAQLNRWNLKEACNVYYRGIGELKRILREKGMPI